MGDRRCCCLGWCWVKTDDFDRAESTDLGINWNEVSGQWGTAQIFETELIEDWSSADLSDLPPTGTGTADSILIYREAVPERSDGEMYVKIDLYWQNVEADDVYFLYPCCTDEDTVGSLAARFTYLGSNVFRVEWLVDDVVSETRDISFDEPSVHLTLYACVDNEIGMSRAGVGDPPDYYYSVWLDSSTTGRYGGIGHDNTSHLNVFDNFEIGELRAPDEVCWACFCMCDMTPMPKTLTLTFVHCSTVDDARMSCLEGMDCTLNFVAGTSSPTWEGEMEIETATVPPVTQTVRFTLLCDSAWTLNIKVFEGEVEKSAVCFTSDYYGPGIATSVEARWPGDDDPEPEYWSTCDPLVLMYGPWWIQAKFTNCDWCYEKLQPFWTCTFAIPPNPIPGGPECQGAFWIAITA